MPQTNKYADVFAKIGAQRSALLSESKLRLLSEAKSLDDFTYELRETVYWEKVSKVELPYTSDSLERAFRENMIDDIVKIVKSSPSNVSSYLRNYIRRFEVENIKAIMRCIIGQLAEDQKISRVYLLAEDFLKRRPLFEKALVATDLKQLADILKNTEYAEAVSQGIKSYEENGLVICFDVLVDKVFYEELFSSYQLLSRKEKRHANFYTQLESTSYLLLAILRGKNQKQETDWLRVILPDKHFLSKETVEALVISSSFDSALELILKGPYGRFFAKVGSPTEIVGQAEKAFKKALYFHALRSRILESFNIGLPLAFMYVKENEVRNLSGLAVVAESTKKTEDMLGSLLLSS